MLGTGSLYTTFGVNSLCTVGVTDKTSRVIRFVKHTALPYTYTHVLGIIV